MPSTQQEILKYTEMLCEALKQNFIEENIRRHKFLIPSSDNPQYHEDRIQEFKDGKCDYDFVIESGRKYHKVVMVSNQRSVCLLYTSPSPRDGLLSRMPSSA